MQIYNVSQAHTLHGVTHHHGCNRPEPSLPLLKKPLNPFPLTHSLYFRAHTSNPRLLQNNRHFPTKHTDNDDAQHMQPKPYIVLPCSDRRRQQFLDNLRPSLECSVGDTYAAGYLAGCKEQETSIQKLSRVEIDHFLRQWPNPHRDHASLNFPFHQSTEPIPLITQLR